jgi:hypothetical protein
MSPDKLILRTAFNSSLIHFKLEMLEFPNPCFLQQLKLVEWEVGELAVLS